MTPSHAALEEGASHGKVESEFKWADADIAVGRLQANPAPNGGAYVMVYAMCAIYAFLFVTKSMGQHSPQRGRKTIAHGASHGTTENKKSIQPRRGVRPDLRMCGTQSRKTKACSTKAAWHSSFIIHNFPLPFTPCHQGVTSLRHSGGFSGELNGAAVISSSAAFLTVPMGRTDLKLRKVRGIRRVRAQHWLSPLRGSEDFTSIRIPRLTPWAIFFRPSGSGKERRREPAGRTQKRGGRPGNPTAKTLR